MVHSGIELSTFSLLIIFIFIWNVTLTDKGAEAKINNGPNFNLRCSCSSGFYEMATVDIFATSNICSDYEDVESILSTNRTNKMLIPMKICLPCAVGCQECNGPRDQDCLKCSNGYFSLAQMPAVDEAFLQSEQLIVPNHINTVDDFIEDYSGDGPFQVITTARCVPSCPDGYIISNNNSSCAFCGTNCNAEPTIEYVNATGSAMGMTEEKVTPAGYYAIPPLIILGVGVVIAIAYVRKKRRITSNSWKNENIIIRQGSSIESKTFLTAAHKTQPVSEYRLGNPYVYVDRPLPHHPLHRGHHGGSAASGWSTDHDDIDGLYETPENRKSHYLKATYPSTGHCKDKIDQSISRSMDDCLHHNHHTVKHVDKYTHPHTKPRSGSLESNHPPKKQAGHAVQRKISLDGIEVPNCHAPPAPIRHIPSASKRRIHNDHIYVNVEESN